MIRLLLLAFLATAFAHENPISQGPCVIPGKFGLFPFSKIFFECSRNLADEGLAVSYFECEDSEYFSNSLQKCISKLSPSDMLLKRRTTKAPLVSTEEPIATVEYTTENAINSTPEAAITTENAESSSELPVSVTESTEESTDVTTDENISSDSSTLIPEPTEDVSDGSTIEEDISTTDITESSSVADDSSTTESEGLSTDSSASTLSSSESTIDGEITSSTLNTDSSSPASSENSISTTETIIGSSTGSASSSSETTGISTDSSSSVTEEITSPESTVFTCSMAGFFPVKSNCNEFHMCQYGSHGALIPSKLTCPKGQNFNPYKQRCVNESRYSRCQGQNFQTSVDTFKCPSEGLFAHKKDCSLYFRCSLNLHKNKFQLSIKRCPSGQFFNLATSTCSQRTVFSCLWRTVNY